MNAVSQMNEVQISAVVCTWNRESTILSCLRALVDQSVDRGNYEVVVVDNNSTDGTQRVVTELAQAAPVTVRYVLETRQGLAAARNAGIDAARGDYLVFLDDDCIADRALLESFLDAFEKCGAGLIAGKVVSVAPEGLVTDLPKGFPVEKRLANLDLGPVRRPMVGHEYAFGGNLAVTKSVAVAVGGFRESLGYSSESKVVGEDTDFCDKIRRIGVPMFWEPTAGVIHRVGPERLTRSAFRRAAIGYGRGSFLRKHPDELCSLTRVAITVSCAITLGLYGIAYVLASSSDWRRFGVELKMRSVLGKLSAALDRQPR